MFTTRKWKTEIIGNVCTSIVSGRIKPKSFDGIIPWVTMTEIQGRYLPSSLQNKYINDEEINRIKGKIIPQGSVIINVVGNFGSVAIARKKMVLNQQLQAFVCSRHIHNEYLAYWLETQKDYMVSTASRTVLPYMNKNNCEGIPVAYPTLSEQKQISEVLLTWDKAIIATEKLCHNSQDQKKALMQQLLTNNKRLPGFSDDWKEIELGDWLVEHKEQSVIQDQSHVLTSSQEGLLPQWQYFSSKRIIQRNNIGFNVIPEGYVTYRSRSDNGLFRFNINETGKTGIVSSYYPVFSFPKGVNKFFVYLFMLQEDLFNAHSVGTSHKVLSINILKSIKMRIPTLTEQQAIVSVLAVADNEIENFQKRLRCLRQGRKALMQQLFLGGRYENK